ncbi:MAG: tRNA (adenosine(37)-N6)-dimethylallyltransferase MiaA, partial [Coriobacteriales bacterium]|nr:tRNA (adenosine(37)-N6)-dimethylallyltransferase MiaA [Coriobacteriales bacterium]
INVEAAVLYEVVGRRVDQLMADGLLLEVQALAAAGHAHAPSVSQAIGYKELLAFLDGRMTLEDAVAAIKQATRRLAKRQRTWFRRDERIRWVEATDLHQRRLEGSLDEAASAEALLQRALALLA